MSEQLELRYVPLDSLAYWDANVKRHDIGAIARSIQRHGFLDPPKWDTNLNGGKGGIAEGNGRKEALERLIEQGSEPPRGIVVKDGQWLIPVLFGVDAESEAQAQSYGLDHNTLTMMGGEFSAIDLSKMYEQESYLDLLKSLADDDALPISVDGDDLDFLLDLYARDDDGDTAFGSDSQKDAKPNGGDDDYSVFELVMLHENKLYLLETLNKIKTQYLYDKLEDALVRILKEFNGDL